MTRTGPDRRRRGDRGSVLPLVIGAMLLIATLVAAVTDASAAYLRRAELDSVADAAALAATRGLQGESIYTRGLAARVRIDPARARSYVLDYLSDSDARRRFPDLRLRVRTTGDTVLVHLSASMRLPLHVPGLGEHSTIGADAASVVTVRR